MWDKWNNHNFQGVSLDRQDMYVLAQPSFVLPTGGMLAWWLELKQPFWTMKCIPRMVKKWYTRSLGPDVKKGFASPELPPVSWGWQLHLRGDRTGYWRGLALSWHCRVTVLSMEGLPLGLRYPSGQYTSISIKPILLRVSCPFAAKI